MDPFAGQPKPSFLAPVPPWEMSQEEQHRERVMAELLRRFSRVKSKTLKRQLWREYKKLHRERSPQYIAFLERQRGIHRGSSQ